MVKNPPTNTRCTFQSLVQEDPTCTKATKPAPQQLSPTLEPVYTRLHSRGSTRVPPKFRGATFLPPISRGGILSLSDRERVTSVPGASQEEAISTGKARGTPRSYHHSLSPPDVSVHSRETCFPCSASIFKPRIDSHHGGTWDNPVGKPRGKASWESLEGKPQIP